MTKTRLRLERRGKYEMKKERAGEGWEHRKEGGDKDEIETLRDEHSQARTQKAAVEVCRTSGIYSY